MPVSSAPLLPDAQPSQQLLGRAPKAWLPYIQLARLDRPIGWWLLVLPCWWSVLLASFMEKRAPHWSFFPLLLIGAIAMRGAGSTYNDLVDIDIDAKVERTRQRPLPSGRVTPGNAKRFILAQAFVGLLVLLCFNSFTIVLGISSLGIVAAYPFMKRFTSWPQAVLGLAFAWGALTGFAAEAGTLSAPAVWLYAGTFFWIIGYDTIYALQDIKDDAIIGVGSTARFFGEKVKPSVAALYAATVLCMVASFIAAQATIWMWVGLAGFAAQLLWQVVSIRQDDNATSLRLFRSNRIAGLILLAGLAVATAARLF